MIPGGNILNAAMSVIQKQAMQYIASASRTAAENGDWVPAYVAPVNVMGSIQPIERSLYEHMGLDFQKNYHNVFISKNVADVHRASAGGQLIYKGKSFTILSNEPWFEMDGWDQCLCVETPTY